MSDKPLITRPPAASDPTIAPAYEVPAVQPPSLTQQLACAAKVQHEALESSEFWNANVDCLSAGLMRKTYVLSDRIERALTAAEDMQEVGRLLPQANVYLRALRQIDRFDQHRRRRR